MTVTARMRTASTSPEGELARHYLGEAAFSSFEGEIVQQDFLAVPEHFEPQRFRNQDMGFTVITANELSDWAFVISALRDARLRVASTTIEAAIPLPRPINKGATISGLSGSFRIATKVRATERPALAAFFDLDETIAPKDDVAPNTDPLEGYEQYSQSNWDGYDAKPITDTTLRYTRRLLKIMPTIFGPPAIAPSGDGSIGLEWIFDSGLLRKLFLDIGPGEQWVAYWTRANGEFGRFSGRSISITTKSDLAKLFDNLRK